MHALAAVGMFDGVHLGHRAIFDTLAAKARETGRKPLVFTFATHPREIITGEPVPLITPADVKCGLIREYLGPDADIEVMPGSVLAMSGGEFLKTLATRHGVDGLVMGFNNRIGNDHLAAADITGVDVYAVDARYCGGDLPSSTMIRRAIHDGAVDKARAMLGHDFTVGGTVEEGRHIGRTIGFPTANIRPADPGQILPGDGSYIVDVLVDGKKYRGMANIGTRPTLNDGRGKTLEVNIFDFSQDIYGHTVDIEFLAPLRRERVFRNLDDLQAQLTADRRLAAGYEK